MSKKVSVFLFGVLCCGQEPSSFKSHELLREAAARIKQNTDFLPRLTCSETVERSFYTQPDRKLTWSDRFRLAVAVFNGRELFSWPGDGKFQYEWPDALIGAGASTAGEFGPFTVNIFLADAGLDSFEFTKLSSLGDAKVANYHYSLPYERSHFLIKMGELKPERTAFEGSFSIDVGTHDLKRLTVDIVHPPVESGMQTGQIVTDYTRLQIGTATVLLPQTSTASLATDTGDLSVNQSRYTDCKEFRVESSLHFEDVNAASTNAQAKTVPQPSLPAGLRLLVRFMSPIDSDKSFAGDPVEAEIVREVKLGNRTLVPAHTHLYGRIAGLRRQFYRTRGVTLSIQFDHLEMSGAHVPVSLAALAPSMANPVLLPTEQFPGDSRGKHIARIRLYDTDHLHFSTRTEWYFQTL